MNEENIVRMNKSLREITVVVGHILNQTGCMIPPSAQHTAPLPPGGHSKYYYQAWLSIGMKITRS